MPNERCGTIRDKFAKNGGKSPQKNCNMKKKKCFKVLRLFHKMALKNQGRARRHGQDVVGIIKARNSWRYRIIDNSTNIRHQNY
jgi:hypothetical protein